MLVEVSVFVHRQGLLHARRATGLTNRDIERGNLGPDPIRGEMLTSTTSCSRGWHARVSEQGRRVHFVAAYFACGQPLTAVFRSFSERYNTVVSASIEDPIAYCICGQCGCMAISNMTTAVSERATSTHVRTSIKRREYHPRLMSIQQHHQRERLSTGAAAEATAVLLEMVGGWVSLGGCVAVNMPCFCAPVSHISLCTTVGTYVLILLVPTTYSRHFFVLPFFLFLLCTYNNGYRCPHILGIIPTSKSLDSGCQKLG